ncbi:MAG: hypothetical protein WC379_18295 [Methanoregula sp.]|jgi:hypothetical protein
MNDLRSPGVIEITTPKWTYIQGRLHEGGLDAGILAKGAMRRFGKLRTGRSLRMPERFFGESSGKIFGKIFGEIVLGKIR